MPVIDRFLIQDIKDRVSIVDVIGSRVSWDQKKTRTGKQDYWACCPAHGEKSPSFHVEGQKGRYHCFGCGISGDALKFLTDVEGMTFLQAVHEMAGMAGIALDNAPEETQAQRAARDRRLADLESRRQKHNADAEADRQRRISTASGMWKSAELFAGSLADTYLRTRGMALDDPNLRFQPALDYRHDGRSYGAHPALIARVQDQTGKGSAIWRIYLRPDGTGKADVPNPKLGLGPAAGGAVRLQSETATEIGIGEGIESSISAGIIDRRLPVWAGLSTSGIIGFQPPPFVKFVRIFPDGDLHRRRNGVDHEPTGLEAARSLHARLQAEGRVGSEIVDPPHNGDWNDVLKSLTETGFWR